jgi:hypothetical protein
VSFALPIVLLACAAAALALRPSASRLRVLAAVLLAGTSLDLLKIGARFNPGTLPADYYPVTPKVRELQEASRGGRFAANEPTLAGTAYMYGLEDVRVHGVTAPASYVDVLQAAAGYTGPMEYPSRVSRLDAPILDFLDTRARLYPGGEIRASETPAAVFPERLIGASDPADLRAKLAAATDFLSQAFVLGPDESFSGAAELVQWERPSPQTIRIHVRCDRARVLALPETDDGGWRVSAYGAPLPTVRIDGAFLGIRLPAGESRIVCRYAPPGLRAGATSSLLAAIILAVLVRRR